MRWRSSYSLRERQLSLICNGRTNPLVSRQLSPVRASCRMSKVCLCKPERLLRSDRDVSAGSISALSLSHTLASLSTPKEARMESINQAAAHYVPWNKGKLVGQKAPLKQREIWAIEAGRSRARALQPRD